MTDKLRLILLVVVLFSVFLCVRMIHRSKLNLRYSLFWLGMEGVLLLFVIFPEIVYALADLCGIGLPINMLFTAFAFFALALIFYLTCIVSQLHNVNRTQTQQLALLEKRIRDLEARAKP